MEKKPTFDPGEEVYFDIPNYGTGRGNVVAFHLTKDGISLYAVYPKTPRVSESSPYVCFIAEEKQLISAPF